MGQPFDDCRTALYWNFFIMFNGYKCLVYKITNEIDIYHQMLQFRITILSYLETTVSQIETISTKNEKDFCIYTLLCITNGFTFNIHVLLLLQVPELNILWVLVFWKLSDQTPKTWQTQRKDMTRRMYPVTTKLLNLNSAYGYISYLPSNDS